MARNKVRNLWTAVVTGFIALCTALGLIAPTASAAVPQTASACHSTRTVAASAMPRWSKPYGRSLPPTMKQRIRAEAHGAYPACRLHPPAEPLTEPLSKPLGNGLRADTVTAHRAGSSRT